MSMWRAGIGHTVAVTNNDDDDWDTDPDFVNDTSEKESRWGAKTIEGSGHQGSVTMDELRGEVVKSDQALKERQHNEGPKASTGYGGKFGVQNDRMDSNAVGFDSHDPASKHASQKDYKYGFGGEYGVQTDRKDKNAEDWNYRTERAAHESQKDHSKGFGGKFGVQTDRQDKSAADWSYRPERAAHDSQKDHSKGFGGKFGVQADRQDQSAENFDYRPGHELHASQKDHKTGFGGQFGVQSDRQDSSALGWNEQTARGVHESQTDGSKGFGGKFGVQSDRQDKSALGWEQPQRDQQNSGDATPNAPVPEAPTGSSIGASSLRSRFEKMAMQNPEDGQKALSEARERRRQEDLKQQEEQRTIEEGRQVSLAAAQRESDELSQPAPAPVPVSTASQPPVSPPPEPQHRQNGLPTRVAPSNPVVELRSEYVPPEPEQQQRTVAAPRVSLPDPSGDMYEELPDDEVPSTDSYIPPEPQPTAQFDEESYETAFAPPELPASEIPELVPSFDGGGGHSTQDHPLAPPSHPMADTGICAVAMYDYQAADNDEISFEPDDVITNIEMIDQGWWRGLSGGRYGLFPANYVELK